MENIQPPNHIEPVSFKFHIEPVSFKFHIEPALGTGYTKSYATVKRYYTKYLPLTHQVLVSAQF